MFLVVFNIVQGGVDALPVLDGWQALSGQLTQVAIRVDHPIALAARPPASPQIVAFRNQLIHGYATVNVSTVWAVALAALPPLLITVPLLLDGLA